MLPTIAPPLAAETVVIELGRDTTWLNAVEVLVVLIVSGLYTAVMLWVPIDRAADVNVATPPVRLAVFSVVAPSLKVTVPVAVAPVTVDVKVTDVPKGAGFVLETRTVLVAFPLVVWTSAVEVLAALFVSPE
jgi:hypothetical protein